MAKLKSLLLLLVAQLAFPAQAATIFSEDFEVADFNALIAKGWTYFCSSTPCTTDIVTTPSHSGAHALRQTYEGLAFTGNFLDPSHDSAIAKTFAPVADLYERYYVRYSCIPGKTPCGWTEFLEGGSNGGSKQHYFNNDSYPNFYTIINLYSDRQMSLVNQSNVTHACPDGHLSITCNLEPPNRTTVPIAFDRWYCIETHLGQGIAEQWVDGTLTGQWNNLTTPSGYYKLMIFRQPGNNMYRYEDDLVVSTTQVGCDQTTSAIPPQAPQGLIVR